MDRIAEIQARLAEINTELETADEKRYAELETESRNLLNELDGLKKVVQGRQELRSKIAAGLAGTTTETNKEEKKMEERKFTLDSEEYRSAFLKNLRGEDMTEVEQRAFTFLTTNTTAPLPTVMQNQIIDLIGEAHPIVADTYALNSGSAITIPVGKSIAADAGKSVEGADHNDLEITFTNIDLSGEDYTADVEMSYKMAAMAIPAFETYLINMISERLGAKLAQGIVEKIKEQMAAGNKIETGINYANICAGFGALKRIGKPVVYGTREAVFNKLVGMVDANKRPIFQQPITAEAAGHLLGAIIKYEDAVGANELLIGDPKKFLRNIVVPVMIEHDRVIKKSKHVYSGYTCQEGTLTDDKAFSLVSEAAAG